MYGTYHSVSEYIDVHFVKMMIIKMPSGNVKLLPQNVECTDNFFCLVPRIVLELDMVFLMSPYLRQCPIRTLKKTLF